MWCIHSIFCMLAANSICITKIVLVFLSHDWQKKKKSSYLRWTFKDFKFLPVVYVCDCRRPVAKDPGLDVHWLRFGISYSHIYYPLQAFTFGTWMEDTQIEGLSKLSKFIYGNLASVILSQIMDAVTEIWWFSRRTVSSSCLLKTTQPYQRNS